MAALLFVTFIVLLLLGVPVAFSIVLSSVAVMVKGDVQLLMIVQRMFASTDSFSLIAVPFFIFSFALFTIYMMLSLFTFTLFFPLQKHTKVSIKLI